MPSSPPCSLYLVTPPLSMANAAAFARIFAEVLAATQVASALIRLARGTESEAKSIVAPLVQSGVAKDCAYILENETRLAARLDLDGVHLACTGEALDAALDSLKPERIVGVGGLRTRDEAMTVAEKGADYVMFGEPFGGAPGMQLDQLVERVSWWAEIFETPCVAYAGSIDAACKLTEAGADFVALDSAVWDVASPVDAMREFHVVLSRARVEAQ